LIDTPEHAGRFTYHDHFFSSEIKFTRDDGRSSLLRSEQLGNITISEGWG
jgi:hypothetical protein